MNSVVRLRDAKYSALTAGSVKMRVKLAESDVIGMGVLEVNLVGEQHRQCHYKGQQREADVEQQLRRQQQDVLPCAAPLQLAGSGGRDHRMPSLVFRG